MNKLIKILIVTAAVADSALSIIHIMKDDK